MMGGKPSKGTKRDKRLKRNKRKTGGRNQKGRAFGLTRRLGDEPR